MPTTRKAVYDAMLPATPVTGDMREKMLSIAEQENLSIAAVTRRAITLFLNKDDSNTIAIASNARQEQSQ